MSASRTNKCVCRLETVITCDISYPAALYVFRAFSANGGLAGSEAADCEVSFSGIEGSVRFSSEAVVTEPSGAVIGLSDASHGSNTNQLGTAPNEGNACL